MFLNVKLNELLSLHDSKKTKDSLELSLGDGVLLQSNPIYRNVRSFVLKAGYHFTTEDFCHYSVLPYASLPQILKAKKIPYYDNVTVFREIETLHPKRFSCAELIKVKSNYLFHESSHCVAEEVLSRFDFSFLLKNLSLSSDSQKAFRLIMAESFANTVESFANIFNQTDEQSFFYGLNSYIVHNRKISSSAHQCLDLIGPQSTFFLMYISYLYSNCLTPEPSSKMLQQLLEIAIPDEKIRKKSLDSAGVRKTFFYAFELSEDFRLKTTGFYMAFSGLNSPLMKLVNIDILAVLKQTSLIQKFISDVSSIFKI